MGKWCGGCLQHQTPPHVMIHELDCMLPKHREAADPIAKIASQYTHRPLGSSFLGLPCRILSINHKKELGPRRLGVRAFLG